jgi:hypothetical protein
VGPRAKYTIHLRKLAIESVVSPRKRAALGKSIELLERLAEAGRHES